MKVIRPKENKTLMVEKRENIYLKEKTMAKIKEKGITLIALVVTIIILLILAGVTISLVVGQGGLINRAKRSVGKYQEASKNEQNILEQYSEAIDEETGEKLIGKIVYDSWHLGKGYCLLNDGKVYSFQVLPSNYDYDFDLTYVTDNVKEIYSCRVTIYQSIYFFIYYLTNDNKLYLLYPEEGKLIADNVKEFKFDGHTRAYLTTSNELFEGSFEKGLDTFVKAGDDVKEYSLRYYITNSNELFEGDDYNMWSYSYKTYKKIADNVKKGGAPYYISNSDELFVGDEVSDTYQNFKKIADNVKEGSSKFYINTANELYICNSDNNKEYKYIDKNVKKYYYHSYMTMSNDLFVYNYNTDKYENIAKNVREYYDKDYYITTSNELYVYNYDNGKYEYTADNVKEYNFEDKYYITTTNEFYAIGENKKLSDDVKMVGKNKFFYITASNKFYYMKYNSETDSYSYERDKIKGYGSDFYINNKGKMRAFIEKIEITT